MHIYEAIQDLQVLGPVKLFNGNYQGHLLHPSQAGFHGTCLPTGTSTTLRNQQL